MDGYINVSSSMHPIYGLETSQASFLIKTNRKYLSSYSSGLIIALKNPRLYDMK